MKNNTPTVRAICTTLFLVLTGGISSFGQNFNFTFGPSIPDEKYPSVFNTVAKQAYVFDLGKKKTVSTLDGYLQPGKTKEFPSQFNGERTKSNVMAYYTNNGKSYVIQADVNKETKKQSVWSQEISVDLQLVGKLEPITSYSDVKIGAFTTMEESGGVPLIPDNLTILKSPNESKILIYKERNSKLEAICFAPGQGVVWTKSITISPKEQFGIIDVEITDAGDVYILGTFLKRDIAERPFVINYSSATKKEERVNIPTKEGVDQWGYCLRFISDGTPVVAGLYKDKKTKEIGYKLHKIDTKTFTIQPFISAPLSKEYAESCYDGAYKPEMFRVEDLLQLENGSLVLNIEGSATKVANSLLTSYFGPAYLVSLDVVGREQWHTTIMKYQLQPKFFDLVGQYFFSKGNKIYMIYNDNMDNFDNAPTVKPKEALLKNKTYVAVVEVDETGNAKKLPLISKDKKETSSISSSLVQRISNNLFYFTFKIGDNYKSATLEANGNAGKPKGL